MPLTNPAVGADLYVALNEEAISCIIETVMHQRPSLFNYATQGFIERPDLLYRPIAAHEAVIAQHNPLITKMDKALPVLGTRYLEGQAEPPPPEPLPDFYSLNYFAQVLTVQVDFSPGNVISMPEGLPALPEQHFAFHLGVAAGVGFPTPGIDLTRNPDAAPLPVLTAIDSVCTFPMDVVLTGFVTRTSDSKNPLLVGIDGFEIVDLQPSGLECLLESYVKMEVASVMVPQLITYLRRELPGLIVTIVIPPKPNIELPPSVQVTLTRISERIPRNPAFQNDSVEAYVHLVEEIR